MTIVPSTGVNNCGGRCRILLHMDHGRIDHITGDPDYPDLMPCIKGLNYHKTFLGSDRLTTPLKRVGKRGEGRFEPISWEEALDIIEAQWVRIRDTYGPQSRYVNYGWGVSGACSDLALAKRLLRLDGGHLGYYNSYSTACCAAATPYLYGTADSGSSFDTLVHSKLILLWGHNPAETRFDNLMYYLRRAKAAGAEIVVIDPRRNATADALNAEWIPVRPSTDAALMDAMAYVIWTERLYDPEFVTRCCQGITRDTMPPDSNPAECWEDYITGAADGTAKTPEWAEAITGVSADTIRQLARRYALAEPAALLQGFGGQRHANGEQFTRGGILLACLTGNVGVSGGWAAGAGYCRMMPEVKLPSLPNPVSEEIPCYAWTTAVERPDEVKPSTGLRGGERLNCGIKLIVNLAGNALINQHGDINRTRSILEDETLCEFILCSDLFLTPSARYADILLPGVSMFECDNITSPWEQGNFIAFSNQVTEPVGESCHPYVWLSELARRLGLYDAFTEGHEDYREWLRVCYDRARGQEPALPDYDTLKRTGMVRLPRSRVAFADRRFPTPSGRVEIYSPALKALNHPKIPPIPRYIPAEEGPDEHGKYPLQLVGWHPVNRCHSVHDNNTELQKRYPIRLWMNPVDAGERGLSDGEQAVVWNGRGRIAVRVLVTENIAPGVTALPTGGWYAPDKNRTERRGSINVLTSLALTPLAFGNGQHTNRVQVIRAEGEDSAE